MGFKTFDLGIHEEVPIADFGVGDVGVTTAGMAINGPINMILFHHWDEPKGIGATNPNIIRGMSSDVLPKPNLVFRFGNPESAQVVINALIEIRDSLKLHSSEFDIYIRKETGELVEAVEWEGNIESEEAVRRLTGQKTVEGSDPDLLMLVNCLGEPIELMIGDFVIKDSKGGVRIFEDVPFSEFFTKINKP